MSESSYPFLFSLVLSSFFSSFLVFLKFGYYVSLFVSFYFVLLVLLVWSKDVYVEGLMGCHSFQMLGGYKMVFYFFILSEVMFFFGMFWYLFDVSLVPSSDLGEVWLPMGIDSVNAFGVPFLNSFILLSSAVSLTWSHYKFLSGLNNKLSLLVTVFLGVVFLVVQFFEYSGMSFSFSDGSYGSIFYMLTGFHGLHVFLGVFFLFINFLRLFNKNFSLNRSLGFDFGILYWHFVDLVWLFLFLFLYFWIGLGL